MCYMDKTYIIAEIGVNHDGRLNRAKLLVDQAIQAGADAVKFQTFKTDQLVSSMAPKAKYQLETTNKGETQRDMLKKLELPSKYFVALKGYCDQAGVDFISTPFDESSAEFLESIGVSSYKIASGEITNLPLVELIASYGKPMIVSTGMCSLGEIEEALVTIQNGSVKTAVVLLHCLSNYPAPIQEINLKSI